MRQPLLLEHARQRSGAAQPMFVRKLSACACGAWLQCGRVLRNVSMCHSPAQRLKALSPTGMQFGMPEVAALLLPTGKATTQKLAKCY